MQTGGMSIVSRFVPLAALLAKATRSGMKSYNFTPRNRSEFVTTLMLEKAIAPAAKIGFSWRKKSGIQVNGASTPAAIGISATL